MMKPVLAPQTQTRSFLVKLMPSFSVLKPVLRPLRPLWAKIRTIRPSPPPIPLQQTTTLMTRPIQLVQRTAVVPAKVNIMMQPQVKVGTFLKYRHQHRFVKIFTNQDFEKMTFIAIFHETTPECFIYAKFYNSLNIGVDYFFCCFFTSFIFFTGILKAFLIN